MNPITQSLDSFSDDRAETARALRAEAVSATSGTSTRTPDLQALAARVVVVDENQLRASTLAAALKVAADDVVVVSGPDGWALREELFPADLVLLALGGRQVSALATGAEAVQRNPYAEVIFYCDDADSPEVAAAAVLGITRIVPAHQMSGWLARAGGLLARAACLRRAAAGMAAAVPPPPMLATDSPAASRLPLPTAEMRFRESYIRCLLTQSGSRQEAAKRAGVPYRTMCEMIRKLGIAGD
jgi:DNA-binding NarL/FixJ family response regulator